MATPSLFTRAGGHAQYRRHQMRSKFITEEIKNRRRPCWGHAFACSPVESLAPGTLKTWEEVLSFSGLKESSLSLQGTVRPLRLRGERALDLRGAAHSQLMVHLHRAPLDAENKESNFLFLWLYRKVPLSLHSPSISPFIPLILNPHIKPPRETRNHRGDPAPSSEGILHTSCERCSGGVPVP
ncbi:hypothetical protein VUR80DRAFT_6746 [Thermomyces stellatus]